jgi:hypothetical protein
MHSELKHIVKYRYGISLSTYPFFVGVVFEEEEDGGVQTTNVTVQ